MENGDFKPRQRAIIYASSSRRRHLDPNGDDDGAGEYTHNASTMQQQQHRAMQRRAVSVAAAGGAGSSILSVPNWFDLPLILPESNPIGARLQRSLEKMNLGSDRATSDEDNKQQQRASFTGYQVPKISHLSPTKDMMRQKASKTVGRLGEMLIGHNSFDVSDAHTKAIELQKYAKHQQYFHAKSHLLLKKRRTTRAGAPVVLDRIHCKSRLKEKIRKDLSKFGLWYMADEMQDDIHDDAMDSVDATVDSIMQQWEDATALPDSRDIDSTSTTGIQGIQGSTSGRLESRGDSESGLRSRFSDAETSESVFLTAVPAVPAIFGQLEAVDGHSEDDNEQEDEQVPEEDEDELSTSENGLQRSQIRPPGMKRRQRLKELHYFVEKQLQKRLYKSWDTIEIAFTGSGDLTTSQIVKFLQNSDVQLSVADAAKVQVILEKHARDVQANEEAEDHLSASKQSSDASNAASGEDPSGRRLQYTSRQKPTSKAKPATLSFEGFRQIFHTKDNKEAMKWKREFDREKSHQRQEKEIYEKELAALEEKVKKRLTESAKHMIDVLTQFRCDPLAIPWGNNQQRLELRSQLFETIFAKPQRRRLSQVSAASNGLNVAFASSSPSVVPEKLTARIVESALLQKYSRNGHFDAIEVLSAAYIFYDFVADCIKSSVARYWKKCEADQWPERQLIFQFRLKKQVFFEWRRFTKHAETLRRFVMRKFVAWKYMTRKLHEHYEFVRISFWPFYVWKRHLQQQIIARGKSAFLKNVVLTYIQLRHFRAIKMRYQQKQWNKRQSARILKEKSSKLLQICWNDWKRRTLARISIHRLWKSRGHTLQRLHKLYMVKVTFYIWRYFAILKKDMEKRKFKCFLELFALANKSKTSQVAHNSKQPFWGNGNGGSVAYPQTSKRPYGAFWYPSPASFSSSRLAPSASSPQMVSKSGEEPILSGVDIVDGGVDSDDEDDLTAENDADFDDISENRSNQTHTLSLTRIMETELGRNIKQKSRLYDLCLALYLKYREKDRREMAGNVITFRKTGRQLLSILKKQVEAGKKNRLASDLGVFRIMHQRFRQWMIGTFYKDQLRTEEARSQTIDDGNSSLDENGDVDSKGRVILHWRRDREWRQIGIEQNPVTAEQLRQDLQTVLINDARRMDLVSDREVMLRRKQQSEDAFLRKEAGATLKVKSAQMQQSQQIMRTRGHRMHDVLDRVYDDLLRQQMRDQLKSSFRSLRVVVMMKYTDLLCRRAQLRNWLRLCNRFIYWEKRMEAFHRVKVKHHVFQTLLKHVVWKWKFQTPDLSRKLQQRRDLVTKYERFLGKHRLVDGSLVSSRLALTKFSPANSFQGLFYRWVQFTQFSHAARQIIDLSRQKSEIVLVQSVFLALKNHMKNKYTLEVRKQDQPFLLRHTVADLDAYHCKLIALKARLPTTQLRKKLARKRHFLLQTAIGSPTLKQLFQEHEEEVRRRLNLENRLMFSAYNERKIHNYAERSSPLYGSTVGRSFVYEKAPPYGSISDVAVICGKKVDGISLVVKTNASLSHEGALHGNPFGNRDVFTLSKGEVLISIEGFASQTVYGLRFGTSSGRLSKWYGHCDKGTKFEIRSEYTSKREEIVGLFGYADGTSLHALGAVFRHTTFKNIFEGLWLQTEQTGGGAQRSSNEGVSLCDRQFSYFLQVRMIDVLNAMKRAHRFALRAHRMTHLPSALTRIRIMIGIMHWLFNSLTHGLVHNTSREEEGKCILQDGMNKRASGEKCLQEGLHAMEVVDSFRDDESQLDVATLGVKKINELREMMEQAQQRIALGKKLIDEGQAEILAGHRILPHLSMTKRMMTAIRKMYRVVQTKDYIDQLDPDVRAILLVGDGSSQDFAMSEATD